MYQIWYIHTVKWFIKFLIYFSFAIKGLITIFLLKLKYNENIIFVYYQNWQKHFFLIYKRSVYTQLIFNIQDLELII